MNNWSYGVVTIARGEFVEKEECDLWGALWYAHVEGVDRKKEPTKRSEQWALGLSEPEGRKCFGKKEEFSNIEGDQEV